MERKNIKVPGVNTDEIIIIDGITLTHIIDKCAGLIHLDTQYSKIKELDKLLIKYAKVNDLDYYPLTWNRGTNIVCFSSFKELKENKEVIKVTEVLQRSKEDTIALPIKTYYDLYDKCPWDIAYNIKFTFKVVTQLQEKTICLPLKCTQIIFDVHNARALL